MIFRLKHHWRTALAAAFVLALASWALLGCETGDVLLRRLVGPFSATEGAGGALVLTVVWGVAAGFGSLAIDGALHGFFLVALGPKYRTAFSQHAHTILGPMELPEVCAGSALAALGEEPFFRGVVLTTLLALTPNPVWAVVATAVVFASCHWLERRFLLFWVWAIGEGILFGFVALRTDSLVAPMIAHGIHDFVGYLACRRLVSEAA